MAKVTAVISQLMTTETNITLDKKTKTSNSQIIQNIKLFPVNYLDCIVCQFLSIILIANLAKKQKKNNLKCHNF